MQAHIFQVVRIWKSLGGERLQESTELVGSTLKLKYFGSCITFMNKW